jgi:hypothetical protein
VLLLLPPLQCFCCVKHYSSLLPMLLLQVILNPHLFNGDFLLDYL